jgi:hypothetical protein
MVPCKARSTSFSGGIMSIMFEQYKMALSPQP